MPERTPTEGRLGVPAYFGPWETSSWALLLAARPAVVVINPDNGPGNRRHRGYRLLVRQLQSLGTTVLAYVATDWLQSSETLAHADASLAWYGADGIFWDQIPVSATSPRDLRKLVNWATTTGLRAQAFNPGQPIPASWRGLAPASAWWVTFEGTGRSYLDTPSEQADSQDWHLVHSVSARDRARVERRLDDRRPALRFATPDRMPNPWDVYPGDP